MSITACFLCRSKLSPSAIFPLISALCLLLAQPAKAIPPQFPKDHGLVGNPPKYALFTFPSKVPVAEISFATTGPSRDGKPGVIWARVLAKGRVRLPTNSELHVNLRFDGLEHLDQLTQLYPCRVTFFCASQLDFEDRHMHYLEGFKDLRSLDLGDTLITDKALPQIGAFSKLTILTLRKTNVTGSGFDSLKNLHHLEDLTIEGTSLKPGNIFRLRPVLPGLLTFRLPRTNISKADTAVLKELKLVRLLTLGANKNINNDCVQYLSNLKDLRILDIDDTSITDKSIPMLIKLPSLREVKVRDALFWKTKEHRTTYGKVHFADITHFVDAPTDIFGPLH
jgi:hypothetical protein